MRRRDQPDVDMTRATRAHRPHLAVSQEPEEHRLGVRRELADLVEEHGAAVRLPEEPGPPLEGAGERAALVAEELAPEKLARERAAVHGLEPGAATAAQPVERGGDELLARPGLAEDQHRHVVRGHAPDPVEERRHRRALPDQPLEPRQWRHARPPGAACLAAHGLGRAGWVPGVRRRGNFASIQAVRPVERQIGAAARRRCRGIRCGSASTGCREA